MFGKYELFQNAIEDVTCEATEYVDLIDECTEEDLMVFFAATSTEGYHEIAVTQVRFLRN